MNKFSAMMGRSTHKIINKMGKGENTKNPEYDAAKESMLQDGARINNLGKEIEAYLQTLQNSIVVLRQVADEFNIIHSSVSGLPELGGSLKEVEDARLKAEGVLNAELMAPLKSFHQQYEILKARAAELENRRVDMDRYHDSLLKKTDKTTGGKDGLAEVDTRYRAAREGYEALLAESMRDFQVLHDDIRPFLEPAVGLFVREQALFATAYGEAFGKLLSYCSSIDTSRLASHGPVITPPQRSAAGPELDAELIKRRKEEKKRGEEAKKAPAAPAGGAAAPPPPRPAAAAEKKEIAIGMYTFKAEESNELAFNKGDRITVISKQGDWWEGELNGKRGIFPANYVALEK